MKFFKHTNNPLRRMDASDCFFRSVAYYDKTQTWDKVFDEVYKIAKRFKMNITNDRVLEYWLETNGYKEIKINKEKLCKIQKFNKGKYIVWSNDHSIFVEDGVLYDTWDSRKIKVLRYWINERLND